MDHNPGQTGAHAGKLVTFYMNGNPNFKGLPASVSKKQFPTFETLLLWLTDKIPLTTGARHIFALPHNKEIKDINSFQSGHSYIVSSTRLIRKFKYGLSKERYWHNKRPSAGRFRKQEYDLFLQKAKSKRNHSYPGSRTESLRSLPAPNSIPYGAKLRKYWIISNSNRDSKQLVFFNPQNKQDFAQMFEDISSMVKCDESPKALYTFRKPHEKIESMSKLGMYKDGDAFLVVGENELEFFEGKQPSDYPSRSPSKRKQDKNKDSHDKPLQDQYYNDDIYDDDDLGQELNSNGFDNDRYSAGPSNGVRQSRDLPAWTDEVRTSQKLPPIGTKKEKPFRKKLPEIESVRVHIHGNLQEFFVPRYGQTESDTSLSDKNIELDWVYGYRGLDGRNNLYTLPTGELLYYVATVVVIYNKKREVQEHTGEVIYRDTQRHYLGHTEDVTCMTVFKDRGRTLVATGQAAGKTSEDCAHVRIWDPYSLVTKCVIGTNFFRAAVVAVSFSGNTGDRDDGSLMMAIDDSSKHTLSVWEWKKGSVIGKTSTTADSVVWGMFHPDDHTIMITHGKQHVYFWKMFWDPRRDTSAKILRDKKSGLLSMDDMPQYVTSVCFSVSGDVLTGDSNGCITVWSRDASDAFVVNTRASESMKHAHNKNIFALCMIADGTLISGAGNEVKAWDSTNNYKHQKTRYIPEGCGSVRTMVQQNAEAVDGAMYLGTTSNSIMEWSMQHKFNMIVQGHSEELWAIASHPDQQVFVTAGYDQNVCKWDIVQHKPMWTTFIEKPGMSVTFHPLGHVVVVGTTVGRLIVLDAHNGSHLASVQVSSDALDGIRFSPDGRMLAMGSHNGNIYIYDVDDEHVYKKHSTGILRGHKNFVNHLDWSKDGKYLQSVSAEYDLLFWNILEMKEVPAQRMREVEWATYSCVLGYNLLGAWSNLRDGEDITNVIRNNHEDEMAVGDNMGNIRIYRYPCTAERPEFHTHKRYSGPVNKMTFTYDDRYLLTSGGSEAGLMQWQIVNDRDYS